MLDGSTESLVSLCEVSLSTFDTLESFEALKIAVYCASDAGLAAQVSVYTACVSGTGGTRPLLRTSQTVVRERLR